MFGANKRPNKMKSELVENKEVAEVVKTLSGLLSVLEKLKKPVSMP
jgi:hypothetical protein